MASRIDELEHLVLNLNYFRDKIDAMDWPRDVETHVRGLVHVLHNASGKAKLLSLALQVSTRIEPTAEESTDFLKRNR